MQEPSHAGPSPVVGSVWTSFSWWSLIAICTIACVPLWRHTWLPLQDLPQHMAAIRVLQSFQDPSFRFQDYFTLHPFRTQYVGYYYTVVTLSHVFGLVVANKIFLSAALVSVPLSLHLLLRQMRTPTLYTWIVLPFLFNQFFLLGFVNFIAGISLALLGLLFALRLRDQGRPTDMLGFFVVFGLCFLMHILPFCVLALGAFFLWMDRSLERTFRRSLLLLPGALLLFLWFAYTPAGRSAAKASTLKIVQTQTTSHWTPIEALKQMPYWLSCQAEDSFEKMRFLLFSGFLLLLFFFQATTAPEKDDPNQAGSKIPQLYWLVTFCLCTFFGIAPAFPELHSVRYLVAFLMLVSTNFVIRYDVLSQRFWLSDRERLLLLSLVCFGLYFFAPLSYRWIWPIAPRFSLFLIVLLPLALYPLGRRAQALLAVFLAALSLSSIQQTDQKFARFQEDVGKFDKVLQRIPKAQRVAGLMYNIASPGFSFAPFLHYVSYYQAARGGAVMFTFADFPHSPFRFRNQNRPPAVPPRWEWEPQSVDLQRSLNWYDYLLVRGHHDALLQQRRFRRIFQTQRWSVWKKRRIFVSTPGQKAPETTPQQPKTGPPVSGPRLPFRRYGRLRPQRAKQTRPRPQPPGASTRPFNAPVTTSQPTSRRRTSISR